MRRGARGKTPITRTAQPTKVEGEWVLLPKDLVGSAWLDPIVDEQATAKLHRPGKVEAADLLRLLSSSPDRLLAFVVQEGADTDDDEDVFRQRKRIAHRIAFQLRRIAECIEGSPWPRGRGGASLEQKELEHAAWLVERRLQKASNKRGYLNKFLIEEAERLAQESQRTTHDDIVRISKQIYEVIRQRKRRARALRGKSGN